MKIAVSDFIAWLMAAYQHNPTKLPPHDALTEYQESLLEQLTSLQYAPVMPKVLAGQGYLAMPHKAPTADERAAIAARLTQYQHGLRAVFINGCFMPDLSNLAALPAGVLGCGLAQALQEYPEQVLSRLLVQDKQMVAPVLLNALLVSDGLFLAVPADVVVPDVLRIINIATTAGWQALKCNYHLLLLGERAGLNCVVEHLALTTEPSWYWHNMVLDGVLGANASLDYCHLQQGSALEHYQAVLRLTQAQDSISNIYAANMGACNVENNIAVSLDAYGASTMLKGSYNLAHAEQAVVNIIGVAHHAAATRSVVEFNGIIADNAQAVFDATVTVHAGAKDASAQQKNRNILLGRRAAIITKPTLLVFADQVDCRHSATSGYLDAEALLYLGSRGLSVQQAVLLLLQALLNSTMDNIKFPWLQRHIMQMWQHSMLEVVYNDRA